jgi:hypothetical protein
MNHPKAFKAVVDKVKWNFLFGAKKEKANICSSFLLLLY